MSNAPIIGITCDLYRSDNDGLYGPQYSLRYNYCKQVVEAGGVPIIIPTNSDMVALASIIDGWLIPGGRDMDAQYFGEENHPTVEMQDPSRWAAESALFERIPADLPIFGVCYGAQFLNVKHGGSLEQHVPDRVGNRLHEGGNPQEYQIEPGSKLAQIIGSTEARGLSYHHQAVGRLGEGLKISARHEDGTVEGIENQSPRFLIGVQWHPERTPDNPATAKLFAAFIQAARDFKANRGK